MLRNPALLRRPPVRRASGRQRALYLRLPRRRRQRGRVRRRDGLYGIHFLVFHFHWRENDNGRAVKGRGGCDGIHDREPG